MLDLTQAPTFRTLPLTHSSWTASREIAPVLRSSGARASDDLAIASRKASMSRPRALASRSREPESPQALSLVTARSKPAMSMPP